MFISSICKPFFLFRKTFFAFATFLFRHCFYLIFVIYYFIGRFDFNCKSISVFSYKYQYIFYSPRVCGIYFPCIGLFRDTFFLSNSNRPEKPLLLCIRIYRHIHNCLQRQYKCCWRYIRALNLSQSSTRDVFYMHHTEKI